MKFLSLPHLATRVFGTPLAIEPQKLEAIVQAIGPRLQGMPMMDREDMMDMPAAAPAPDGIAIIDISGTLVRKATGMQALSGLTSYASIAADLQQAVNDPMVKAIVLDIDSPGGEVDGMFDLADAIYQAREEKLICAIAAPAYSAAYLLASAADEVWVSRTGGTGSIGVIGLHLDQSEADAKEGLKYTAIYAGAHKNDLNPHQPLSDAAYNRLKADIDNMMGLFVEAVARNRAMTLEAVRATEALTYLGQQGIDAKLADRMGTMEDALASIAARMKSMSLNPQARKLMQASSVAPATKSQKGEKAQMAEETKPAAAEATETASVDVDALVAQARSEGYAEASVIVDLCAIAGVPPAKAVEYIGQKKTAAQVRQDLLKAKADAQQATTVDTAVMPGADAQPAESTQGKARPWGEVMAEITGRKFGKGGK